jgi:ribonuclease HII
MKYFGLFFLLTTFLIGCESIQKIDQSKELTSEQKQKLDKRIPPEIREILDKAQEITISYNVDKDSMKLNVLMSETVPNAEAKVSNSNVKQEFLESFYADASSNGNGNACFSPRQRLKAEYKEKIVEVDICYECGRFKGKSPSGDFGGAFGSQIKSSAVMDAIIEKYGTKIK